MAKGLRTYLLDPTKPLPDPIEPSVHLKSILELHGENGGSTFSLYFGDQTGEALYAVSIFPERARVTHGLHVRRENLQAFIAANRDLLEDPRCCLGTWYNEEDGLTYLDISI